MRVLTLRSGTTLYAVPRIAQESDNPHCGRCGSASLRLLAAGIGWTANGLLGGSPGPAHDPHLPAPTSSTEESITAIGLEPRHANAGRHLERLQDISVSGIDSSYIALVTFPRAVPEFSVDPSHPSDEAVRLNRAKDRACLRIDLMDLPISVLPDPERPFGPCE